MHVWYWEKQFITIGLMLQNNQKPYWHKRSTTQIQVHIPPYQNRLTEDGTLGQIIFRHGNGVGVLRDVNLYFMIYILDMNYISICQVYFEIIING